MSRTGKIARLPGSIRLQLNQRLENNEPASVILPWLTEFPGVQEVMNKYFQGAEISKQNLSEWRRGGFVEWQTQQELLAEARACGDQADELMDASMSGKLIDKVAAVLTAHYARTLNHWPDEPDDAFEAKLKLLNQMTRSVVRLQRSIHRAARQDMEDEEHVLEIERREEEEWRKRQIHLIHGPRQCHEQAKLFGDGDGGYRIARLLYCLENGLTPAQMNSVDGFDDIIAAKKAKAAAEAESKNPPNPSKSNQVKPIKTEKPVDAAEKPKDAPNNEESASSSTDGGAGAPAPPGTLG